MKDCHIILAAMLCMCQGGFSGSGKAKDRCDIGMAVSKGVFFLSAMAGSITIAVRNCPCNGQCTLLVFSEIPHSEESCTVVVCIEIGQTQWMLFMLPLWIRENIDVGLALDHTGFCIHFFIIFRQILEVDEPVIKDVFFSFRDQQVCFYHEFRIQTNISSCMVHRGITGIIDSIHQFLIQIGRINARFTDDPSCCCTSACYRAVVEKEHLGIRRQSKGLAFVYRHIGDDGSRGVLCHFIGLLKVFHFYHIVAVESCLDDGTGL